MKKPLLISLTALAVLGVTTATTLYAQTTTGSSVIARMKAAVAAFTLTADLNPGQTGLSSAPLVGKKTGDVLTAGEYNRLLEILAQSGAGISDVEVITSQDVGAAAGTSYANRWSEANCPAGKKIISGGCTYPNTRNSFIHNAPKSDLSGWTCGGIAYNGDISSTSAEYPTRPTTTAVCGVYGGSDGGGGAVSTGSSNPLFYYCTNAQSLDSTNAPCYGASRNQGLGDGRYRVVSCHIKGSTGHESINSQLLNFGRTGLAAMQDKWNSLYTDSQWQLCIDGSVLVVDTQGGDGGGSSSSSFGTAWVNFDGTQSTIAMKRAKGIASVTKVSAGNYQINFTTPRANTDYGIICTSGPSPAYLCFPDSKTTTGFLLKTSNPTNNIDAAYISVVID